MKYFTIDELCKSTTASRYGIDNTPDEQQTQNLTTLVEKVLDPLRVKMNMPIIVNSGFRCEKLNKKVGGSKTSQHLTGQAADIQTIGDKYNTNLYQLAKTLDFDQLIAEDIDKNGNIGWVHISYVSPEKNRHQILEMRKVNGKITYTHLPF